MQGAAEKGGENRSHGKAGESYLLESPLGPAVLSITLTSARTKIKEIVSWLIKEKEGGMCGLSDLPGLCRRLMSDGSQIQYF